MAQVQDSFVPTATSSPLGVSPMSAQPVQPMRNAAPEQEMQSGAAVQRLGMEVNDIGERIQNRLDDAMTKEADNKLTQATMDTLQPYLQLQGKDAVNAYADTKKAIDTQAQDLHDGLSDDLQKQMFRQVAVRRLMQANAQMQQHYLSQSRVYDLAETQKRAEINSNAAIAQWGTWKMDNSPFVIAKGIALNSVDEVMKKEGVESGSAIAQEAHLAASTNIHMNVIGQMLTAQKPGEAKDYFDQYQSEIDPRRWDDIGKSIKSQGALSDGTQMAMAKLDDLTDSNVEDLRSELYKECGGGTENFKADTFKVSSAQLDSMYQQHQMANKQKRDQLAIPVYKAILNAEANGGKLDPATLGAMPEFQAMKLSDDPATVATAVQISDHVFQEHHAVQVEQRAEARAERVSAAQERQATHEAQRSAWDELNLNPQIFPDGVSRGARQGDDPGRDDQGIDQVPERQQKCATRVHRRGQCVPGGAAG